MNQEILGAFSDDVRNRDAYELSLGDVLDTKVSILLATITFLAGLSGVILLSVELPFIFKAGQIVSLATLSVAGALSIWELWPRDYDFPELPKFWAVWIEAIEKIYEGDKRRVELAYRAYVSGFAERAQERIDKNHVINLTKSRLMKHGFWLTAVSLSINLLTLWWLAFWYKEAIPCP